MIRCALAGGLLVAMTACSSPRETGGGSSFGSCEDRWASQAAVGAFTGTPQSGIVGIEAEVGVQSGTVEMLVEDTSGNVWRVVWDRGPE